MTLDEIRIAASDLEIQLHNAAATMELNNKLHDIYKQLQRLQEKCPHMDNEYNYKETKKVCPICGKKFGGD